MIISDYYKAAHEVKNTISLARANLDLLEAGESNEANLRKYRLIKAELIRIHDLMMDILRFAKEEPMNKTKLNPREIIRELVYEYFESRHYSFNFKFDAPPHEVYISGDRAKIRQVFSNIIKNALDSAAEDRRLSLFVQIEVESRFIKITIKDNGVGFQPEEAESVSDGEVGTDRGDKATAGEQTVFNIYGLGLLISKSIIAEHGGFLELQSETGVGATVCVRLPVYF